MGKEMDDSSSETLLQRATRRSDLDDFEDDDNPFSFEPLYVDPASRQLMSETPRKPRNRRYSDSENIPKKKLAALAAGTTFILIVIFTITCVHILYRRILPGLVHSGSQHGPDLPEPDASGCTGRTGSYQHGAVAADAVICSKIGSDILKRTGATAVDAAIATLLCQGVANSHSMGIGGGHFMVIYKRASKKVYVLDARETVPAAVNQSDYVDESSHHYGPKAIAIPGELKGMQEAHRRFGGLPWSDLFKPTIKLCDDGVPITPALFQILTTKNEYVVGTPKLRKLYIKEGTWQPHSIGFKVKRPELAATLRKIAQHGADDFYSGGLAAEILADINEGGGMASVEDLKNYTAKWRQTVNCTLSNGYTFYGLPPPSSFSVLCHILKIMQGFPEHNVSTTNATEMSLFYHRMVEAFKFGFSKRFEMGDEQFENITEILKNLTSEAYADFVRSQISDTTTYDPDYYGNFTGMIGQTGTSHISVLAPNGDAVAVTSTINTYFGSMVVGNRTGIIFNNEMEDFSYPMTTKNLFGLPSSPFNYIAPGKRPMSSMCPTVGTNTRGDIIITGASGGSHIISATAHTMMRILLLGDTAKEAIDAPRIHHQWLPNVVAVDKNFPIEYIQFLKKRGHKVRYLRPFAHGATVQTVIKNRTGNITAYCDIRKGGCPSGF